MGLLGSIGKAVKGVVGGALGGGGGGGGTTVVNSQAKDNSGLFNYLAQQQSMAQAAQLANQQANAQSMQGGVFPGGGQVQQPQQMMMMDGGGGEGYDANAELSKTLAQIDALRRY